MFQVNILLRDTKEGNWRTLGKYELHYLPRQGEHLELFEDTENNDLYRVVSIHHLLNSHSKSIDVYAVKEGSKLDVLRSCVQ